MPAGFERRPVIREDSIEARPTVDEAAQQAYLWALTYTYFWNELK